MVNWSGLPPAFRAILIHTINCALAVLSFIFLFWLTHKGLNPGWPLTILDQTENIVLTVIYVYFAVVLIYDLTEERVRAIFRFFSHQVLVA